MIIYLARHTQSIYNVKRRLNSDPSVDVHLSKKGIQQAHDLRDKLKSENFDVIYISEFPRTKQTADIINTHHGLEVVVDTRINENLSGFEGQSAMKYLWAFHKSSDPWNERFNDGESIADVKDRVANFLQYLKQKGHPSVLIVTHGTVIETIYAVIEDLTFDEAQKRRIKQGNFAKLEF